MDYSIPSDISHAETPFRAAQGQGGEHDGHAHSRDAQRDGVAGVKQWGPGTEDAHDLLRRHIPAERHLVEGLLREGLAVLTATSKAGKSYLLLLLAICVAKGHDFLGHEVPQPAAVLYLSLENGDAEEQDRLFQLLDKNGVPKGRIGFAWQWARFGGGEQGLTQLRETLTAHPEIKLVVVDMLANVRPLRKAQDERNLYESDRGFTSDLNKLALERHVAIVASDHANTKPFSETDPFRVCRGTMGTRGGTSANWVLYREWGKDTGYLYVASRGINLSGVPVKRDELSGAWLADAKEDELQQQREQKKTARQSVLDLFTAERSCWSVGEVADALPDLSKRLIVDTLSRLFRNKQVERSRDTPGTYQRAAQPKVHVDGLLTADSLEPQKIWARATGHEQPDNVQAQTQYTPPYLHVDRLPDITNPETMRDEAVHASGLESKPLTCADAVHVDSLFTDAADTADSGRNVHEGRNGHQWQGHADFPKLRRAVYDALRARDFPYLPFLVKNGVAYGRIDEGEPAARAFCKGASNEHIQLAAMRLGLLLGREEGGAQ